MWGRASLAPRYGYQTGDHEIGTGQSTSPARRLDWVPLFRWVGSQADAADRICLRTVDYPDRVQVAAGMIETAHGLLEMAHMGRELPLSATLLHRIHRGVFSKADFRVAGEAGA